MYRTGDGDGEERIVLNRDTDPVRSRFETYYLEKKEDGIWEVVGYEDDREKSHFPPNIGSSMKEDIADWLCSFLVRDEVKVEVAPIYALKCDCGTVVTDRVEVEENEHGNERPVNETEVAECWMCDEEREMDIFENGLVTGRM